MTIRNEMTPSELIIHKLEFILLVFSTTCYFYFVVRSISRIRSTGDKKFYFLLIAATFAFMNNSGDIYYRIMAPLYGTHDCSKFFIIYFRISGSLNWIPVSYYQVLRLYYITYNYYEKNWRRFILYTSICLSLIYSVCYLLNLFEFYGNKDSFGGCVVSNTNKYGHFVEISDLTDSYVSLAIVIFTLFQSIRYLKRYKLRHHRIKAILDESLVLFIFLLISKVIFYTLILLNSGRPGGDIFYDGLSVIVLFCTYRLLNISPKLNEKMEFENIIKMNERSRKFYKELSELNKANQLNSTYDRQKAKKPYNRNSKGELNFPSILKTNSRQLDTRQLDTRQLDTRQLDTRQFDTRQFDTRQFDTRQFDTRQFDTRQLDTRQVNINKYQSFDYNIINRNETNFKFNRNNSRSYNRNQSTGRYYYYNNDRI